MVLLSSPSLERMTWGLRHRLFACHTYGIAYNDHTTIENSGNCKCHSKLPRIVIMRASFRLTVVAICPFDAARHEKDSHQLLDKIQRALFM